MSFRDIIGQDRAVRLLKNIIEEDRIIGSYIFLGPEGVGKSRTALEFTKAINCEKGGLDACGQCSACVKINAGNHPDVFLVSREAGSGSIKIERIREILYYASLKPYEAKKKVFIIEDAEFMTLEAQSALLKLLEESSENQVLILSVSNEIGILPTVLSRCRVLKFATLTEESIKEFLKRRDFTDEESDLFSHMSLGSLKKAISFKEDDLVTKRDELLANFCFRGSALFKEDIFTGEDLELEESLSILLFWYRDLLISKFSDERDLFLNIDRFSQIRSFSSKFSKEKLERDIFEIIKTIGYLKRNINPKIAVFNMALQMRT